MSRKERRFGGKRKKDKLLQKKRHEEAVEHTVETDQFKINNTWKSVNEEDEKLHRAIKKVLEEIKIHKNVSPFLQPVDEAYAPDYSSIIKEPMSISLMEEKLERRAYKNKKDFELDFGLMINNCKTYNGTDSDYTKMAEALLKSFGKLVKQHLSKEVLKNSVPCLRLVVSKSQPKQLYISRNKATHKSIKIVIRQSADSYESAVKLDEQVENIEDCVSLPIPRIHLERINVSRDKNGETIYSVSTKTTTPPSERLKDQAAPTCSPPQPTTTTTTRRTVSIPDLPEPAQRTVISSNATVQESHPINPRVTDCVSISRRNSNGRFCRARLRKPARGKRRKKKPVGMKAIEALALAAEQALKDAASRSSFEDSPLSSQGCTPEYDSSAFPDLKISTTQSHPAALVERLFGTTFKDKDNSLTKQSLNVKNEVVENNFNDLNFIVKGMKDVSKGGGHLSDDSDYGSGGDLDMQCSSPKRTLENDPQLIKPCQVSLSRVNTDKVFKGMKHRITDTYFSNLNQDTVKEEKMKKANKTLTATATVVVPDRFHFTTNCSVPPRKRYSALVPPSPTEWNIQTPEKQQQEVASPAALPENITKPMGVYEYVTDSEEEMEESVNTTSSKPPSSSSSSSSLLSSFALPYKSYGVPPLLYTNAQEMCHRLEAEAFSSPFVDNKLLTPLNLDKSRNNWTNNNSWRLS